MHNSTPAAASAEHRLEALELFIQHLVLVIECHPSFTAKALDRWVHL